MNNFQNSLNLDREKYLECNWENEIPQEDLYRYSSVMRGLQNFKKKMSEAGNTDCIGIFELLSKAASMMLVPNSTSEPFKPIFEDFQLGKRSTLPEDFTHDELTFFEQILNDINEPFFKARIADLLWVILKPKKVDHAKIAIDAYITHKIDDQTWHLDIKQCFERAARLSMQIKDWERLEQIKSLLTAAFIKEYPDGKYMQLWIADLLDRLNIDKDIRILIAQNLHEKAKELKVSGDYHSAISYFELSAKKYQQVTDKEAYVKVLIDIAECYEAEGDSRSKHSNAAANGFYENTIQSFRRIPAKERNTYNIENKIRDVRQKIIVSGQATLGEMVSLRIPDIDISEIIQKSIEHVKGKTPIQDALLYFSGISQPIEFEKLLKNSQEILDSSLFSNMFGGRHFSNDGRLIAKTPSMNLTADMSDPDNQAVLFRQMQSQFSTLCDLAVQGQILPALRQLNAEHRITKELMIEICKQSPIVANERSYLLGNALWLGFEEDFSLSIHLICPQVEHIVRLKLKESGVITTCLDNDGLESEIGLSSLLNLPESEQIFGKSLCFELRSLFTEALGCNLRNKVAHGLLGDNDSISVGSIYAWWSIFRLVVTTIISGQIKRD